MVRVMCRSRPAFSDKTHRYTVSGCCRRCDVFWSNRALGLLGTRTWRRFCTFQPRLNERDGIRFPPPTNPLRLSSQTFQRPLKTPQHFTTPYPRETLTTLGDSCLASCPREEVPNICATCTWNTVGTCASFSKNLNSFLMTYLDGTASRGRSFTRKCWTLYIASKCHLHHPTQKF